MKFIGRAVTLTQVDGRLVIVDPTTGELLAEHDLAQPGTASVFDEHYDGARPLPKEQVDHINGDRLDNRRTNLRIATHGQNSFNAKRISTFGYTGVSRNHARLSAVIAAKTDKLYIGTFDTPDEAAWMRDQWAIELHGDFARLNFEYVDLPDAVKLGVPSQLLRKVHHA
ncbi:hypothetical protein A2J03_06545 [Rhodococcus sp. EPR-157]|nr:hypothetical protein A2J03_06545 [Rhodococcus sp. EPR-157]